MKKYAIGLITGALLAVSAMMFMGAQNKNLGDITAESIKLVSEHGETFIVGGGILISNADGKQTAILGNNDRESGNLSTYNSDGKQTVYLGTSESGSGHLNTYNADGKQTANFGTGKGNDGFIGLYNHFGDIGWSARGWKY